MSSAALAGRSKAPAIVLVGRCGGAPYLDPNAGKYQEQADLVPSLVGSFADCHALCTKLELCIKFEREHSSSSCFFSGERGAARLPEPNGDPAWSCGLLGGSKSLSGAEMAVTDVEVSERRYTLMFSPGAEEGRIANDDHLLSEVAAQEVEAYVGNYFKENKHLL